MYYHPETDTLYTDWQSVRLGMRIPVTSGDEDTLLHYGLHKVVVLDKPEDTDTVRYVASLPYTSDGKWHLGWVAANVYDSEDDRLKYHRERAICNLAVEVGRRSESARKIDNYVVDTLPETLTYLMFSKYLGRDCAYVQRSTNTPQNILYGSLETVLVFIHGVLRRNTLNQQRLIEEINKSKDPLSVILTEGWE